MMCASVHIKVATDKREYPAAIPPLEKREARSPRGCPLYISQQVNPRGERPNNR